MKILLYYEEKRLKRELLNLKTEKKTPKNLVSWNISRIFAEKNFKTFKYGKTN